MSIADWDTEYLMRCVYDSSCYMQNPLVGMPDEMFFLWVNLHWMSVAAPTLLPTQNSSIKSSSSLCHLWVLPNRCYRIMIFFLFLSSLYDQVVLCVVIQAMYEPPEHEHTAHGATERLHSQPAGKRSSAAGQKHLSGSGWDASWARSTGHNRSEHCHRAVILCSAEWGCKIFLKRCDLNGVG